MEPLQGGPGRATPARRGGCGSTFGAMEPDGSDKEGGRDLLRGGLRAVRRLERPKKRIQTKPYLAASFERRAREDPGVVPGPSWPLNGLEPKQQWGKLKRTTRVSLINILRFPPDYPLICATER